MTNADLIENIRYAIAETKKVIARGNVYVNYAETLKQEESDLVEAEASTVDVFSIITLTDKAALKAVPEADFDFCREMLHYAYKRTGGVGTTTFGTKAFYAEATRRKAAATRAENTAAKAARAAAKADYADGETVEVHAFGHWYKGKVVRTTRTGSVVVEYTSGTGTTRQKTVCSDLIRKVR
jgi:uncharacterized protein with FMN-binding domain